MEVPWRMQYDYLEPRWIWHFEWQTPREFSADAIDKVIYAGKSKYQIIEVVETFEHGRALILDGRIQSAEKDEWVYHEAIVHPPMLAHPWPERVLVIGGGEGANLRELLKHRSVKEIVMVDLDEEVINIAKKYLWKWHQGAFENPKVKLIIGDGRKFVSEYSGEKFDVVVLDLTDPVAGGPSYYLYTYEFYSLIKNNVVKPDGVVVTQATSLVYSIEAHAMIRNTLAKVFKKTSSYKVFVPAFHSIWSFVVASDKWDPKELSKEEVEKRISERIVGELRFYDGETHVEMFLLPKHIRKRISEIKEVAYDKKPPSLPL